MTERSPIQRNRAAVSSIAANFALVISGLAATASIAAHAQERNVGETPRTSAAVIAVDDHWLQAEVGGDTAWLDAMLMPDYRSISPEGKVLDKRTLLAHAEKNRDSDKMRNKVNAWLKSHPIRKSVAVHGDIAILSFSDPATGRVRSSDVFIYTDGGWHALYSQHSASKD